MDEVKLKEIEALLQKVSVASVGLAVENEPDCGEYEREFADYAAMHMRALLSEVRTLRTKLATVQVYARGIYGDVPPLSFDDWYDLVTGKVRP